MSETTIHYTNGESEEFDKVFIMMSGWVRAVWEDKSAHYPPHQIKRIGGEARHQSPHGGV